MEAEGRGGECEAGRPVLRKVEETLQTDGWKGGVSRSRWGDMRLTLGAWRANSAKGFFRKVMAGLCLGM